MKHVKKLVSLLVTLVMVLGLGTTAFAENTHTYEIYQIFTGDYADGILSNVKWGQNGTGTEGDAVDTEVLTALEEVADSTSDTKKLEVITKYADLTTDPVQTGSETSYSDLADGYYLVKDKDGSQKGENGYYTLYVVQVVDGILEFEPKGNVPKTDKKILEDGEEVDVNEASIGDTVTYQITGTLPSNFADYKEYYYVFTDTLSKGLTFNEGSITVSVDGENVTDYFYKDATMNEDNSTTITVGIQDIVALNNVEGVNVDKDSKIVVTCTATLNEGAVIAGEGNPNDVKLDYSNDPNNSGDGTKDTPPKNPDEPKPTHPTGETPKSEVVTYTTELTILKTDENGAILPGAEFTLTGEGVNIVLVTTATFTEDASGDYWKLADGTYTTTAPSGDNSDDYESTTTKYSKEFELVAKGNGKNETDVVGTVDPETGKVTFSGLGAGTYTISETTTPAGYNTIEDITFTITFDADTQTFESDNGDVQVDENDNTLYTKIINQKGATLPSTGGMGTTIFYILGAILVIAAGLLLIAKKRMENKN